MKLINRAIEKESRAYPTHLVRLSQDFIESRVQARGKMPLEMWRSREFLLQIYEAPGGLRLSANRTHYVKPGRWGDEITWDELQRLKAECGRGDKLAIEIFPPDEDIVNVANMRHLWVIDALQELPFVWRQARREG